MTAPRPLLPLGFRVTNSGNVRVSGLCAKVCPNDRFALHAKAPSETLPTTEPVCYRPARASCTLPKIWEIALVLQIGLLKTKNTIQRRTPFITTLLCSYESFYVLSPFSRKYLSVMIARYVVIWVDIRLFLAPPESAATGRTCAALPSSPACMAQTRHPPACSCAPGNPLRDSS